MILLKYCCVFFYIINIWFVFMWKTKKDYIRAMRPLTKIFYYLGIIKHINYLPVKTGDELEYKDGYYQTLKNNEYATYYKWNWYNPLTYIVKGSLFIYVVIMNTIMSYLHILASDNIFTVKIID